MFGAATAGSARIHANPPARGSGYPEPETDPCSRGIHAALPASARSRAIFAFRRRVAIQWRRPGAAYPPVGLALAYEEEQHVTK